MVIEMKKKQTPKRRIKEVRIKLYDDEHAQFIARSGKEKLAPYVRRIILKQRKAKLRKSRVYSAAEMQVIRMCSYAFNNLNQLTKKANTDNLIELQILVSLERSLADIAKALKP